MTSEVIIDARPKEISIALLEDKCLVEYQNEPREASYAVGNIYVGKVRKLMPGLNACFVDVGSEKDAFLHYLDLGLQFSSYEKYLKQVASDRKKLYPIQKATIQPTLPKEGSIQNILKVGQEIMVQVVKEPINTKGPRLTCELSFAGRYMVLIPFGDKVSVSSKIKRGEERSRLKQLVQSMKPKNFGVIVRTVAEGKKAAELDQELKVLLKRWEDAITKVQKTTERPQLVFEEQTRAVALLRDLFNPTYDGIHVNDPEIYNQIHDYVSLIAPEKASIVKLYKGNVPIFDNFDVTKQIKSGFGRTVNYKRGAYLIIEHTEAMHVVDVNSGTRIKKENGQEANALETNLGAADELARQLRLRDMGGIIVVDFIDMNLAEDRQLLYERMCENMKKDRARHNILPLSKFGLMQITRQRVRPAMDVAVEESCPTCHGTGKIKSSILFTDQLESKIDRLVNKIGIKRFTLHVHPYVAAFINQGVFSLKRRWQLKYGLGVRIIPNQKMAFLQYEFYDANRQFIDMQEENEVSK
ncbi:ribonuclease G [Prevotella communis]|jgi:ribonuclease G|uniref:Ribonuclease G n=1 Tax=Prevotella communis TaxID=2913614 RepID=A0A1G7WH80_9BACT|nr:Rne/Rng family ribonuclease [Prevotella communis]UKK66466.1 Rne/Rng family ribonuclease [Prevotella communis]UKK71394.1 Rne/Rng family ribonuclease [Prevotella communis]SDG71311.1 ribonuclease G [Prevotella communis]